MPKLIEYISVGFCSGYGDGDYRVSMDISQMDLKRYDELRLAMLNALNCADRIWREAHSPPAGQAGQSVQETVIEEAGK